MNEIAAIIGIILAIGFVLVLIQTVLYGVLESRRLARRFGDPLAQRIRLRYEVLKMFAGFLIAIPIMFVLAYFAITQENQVLGKIGFFVGLGAVAWAKVAGRIYLWNLAQDECPKCSTRVKFYLGDGGKNLECEHCSCIWATPKPRSSVPTSNKKLPKKINVPDLD